MVLQKQREKTITVNVPNLLKPPVNSYG